MNNFQSNNVDNVGTNFHKIVTSKDTLNSIQEDNVNYVKFNVKQHNASFPVKHMKTKNKNRRPLRGRKIFQKKAISIISGNANGLKAKLFSLENIISDLKPSIIGIQETHFKK